MTFSVEVDGESWQTVIRPSVFQGTPSWDGIEPLPISNDAAIRSAKIYMTQLVEQGWPEGVVIHSVLRSYDSDLGHHYWLVRFELSDLQTISIAVLLNGKTVPLSKQK